MRMAFFGVVVGRQGQAEANGGRVGAVGCRGGSCRTDGRAGAAERGAADGVAVVVGFCNDL